MIKIKCAYLNRIQITFLIFINRVNKPSNESAGSNELTVGFKLGSASLINYDKRPLSTRCSFTGRFYATALISALHQDVVFLTYLASEVFVLT